MVIALTGIAVATSIFALSRTIWQMIVFRCLAGIFSGNIVYVTFSYHADLFPELMDTALSER